MIRIRLIVTGDVEELALATSLGRIFPGVQFTTVRKKGFTSSHPLREPDLHINDSKALDIVTEMIAAGDAGMRPNEPPHDYALAIDDLELMNAHQPHMVLKHVNHAVDIRLDQLLHEDATRPRLIPKGHAKRWHCLDTDAERRKYLSERCSFHLMSPMVESLFFGDKNGPHWPALTRAGAKELDRRPPHFDPTKTDIEAFITDDPIYIGYEDNWIPDGQARRARWATLKNKMFEDGQYTGRTWREAHPKNYLDFLCDPTGKVRKPYKEVDGGKSALETLDWQTVTSVARHARMARSLIDDIADMVGVSLDWLDGDLHPLTARRDGGLLRNVGRKL